MKKIQEERENLTSSKMNSVRDINMKDSEA